MLQKKNMMLLISFWAAFFIVFASSLAWAGNEPIKLGFTSAWDFAGGQGVKRGTLMAVEDINAAGGVMGRKIIPVSYDNKGSADEAKR